MNIEIVINKIKNINRALIELPFDRGLYAIVGENGCGKSTLMLLLSLIVKTSSSKMLSNNDISSESYVNIKIDDKCDEWNVNRAGKLSTNKYNRNNVMYSSVHYHGFYEGSIFYGSRFYDYNIIDNFIQQPDHQSQLIDADPFVIETLGKILHNDMEYYRGLKKIKNRNIAKQAGFRGMPYFLKVNNTIINQYRMSSGESMLISLIDFINNLVIRANSYDKLFFLIDEVELALHPAAIDRLVFFLRDLVKNSKPDLVIYFSTHSAELIQRIKSRNIFLVDNDAKKMELINPCYPNYAVRNLYIPNGFDFLILVEDELAKALVEKIIIKNGLSKSKLYCVLPAGGCNQMIKLHSDMVTYNALGVGKKIISIYDGDVKGKMPKDKKYSLLPKTFIPINSVEKFLKKKCIDERDKKFIKCIGDKYFTQRDINDIINDYNNDSRTKEKPDNDGKAFYKVILSNLNKIGIAEEKFIQYLCDDIYEYVDFTKFENTLKRLMQ
ncbi:MAG: AAA family ATPase [Clostridia bacterium]|nr:AAA family ATPase [Clostridia bacterium]